MVFMKCFIKNLSMLTPSDTVFLCLATLHLYLIILILCGHRKTTLNNLHVCAL